MAIFINNLKNAFIRETSFVGSAGQKKYNISIPVDTTVSASGYITLVASERQIFDVKRRDGSVIAGLKNILLGDEESKIVVSTTRDPQPIMGDDGKAHIKYSYDKWEVAPQLVLELKSAADCAYKNRNEADAVKAAAEEGLKKASEALAAGFVEYDAETAKARYATHTNTNTAELDAAKAEIEALRAKLAERDGDTAENPFA
jgi:hypothetical protein